MNDPAYYTDDVTLMPASVIWRGLPSTSLRPVLFLYFFSRKLFGLRFPAAYGVSRLETLPVIDEGSLCISAQQSLAPFIDEYEDNEFTLKFYAARDYIGSRDGVTAVLLNAAGTTFATVTRLRIALYEVEREKLVTTCHSVTKDGTILQTSPSADHMRHPELIPSGVEMSKAPEHSSVSDLIQLHLERMRDSYDRLTDFTTDSLKEHILAWNQRVFDHMVENGYYARLNDIEIATLGG